MGWGMGKGVEYGLGQRKVRGIWTETEVYQQYIGCQEGKLAIGRLATPELGQRKKNCVWAGTEGNQTCVGWDRGK